MFLMFTLLADCIVLSQEEMNKRKTESSPKNSDKYVKVTINSKQLNYDGIGGTNQFNKGNKNIVSTMKFSDTTTLKENLCLVVMIPIYLLKMNIMMLYQIN